MPSCSSSVATTSRRRPWRTATSTWPNFHGALNSRSLSGKTNLFSRSGYTRARNLHFLFPVPNCNTEFLTFFRSSQPFFSRVPPASMLAFVIHAEHHNRTRFSVLKWLGPELPRCVHTIRSYYKSISHMNSDLAWPLEKRNVSFL
jgi:hypothetical protein